MLVPRQRKSPLSRHDPYRCLYVYEPARPLHTKEGTYMLLIRSPCECWRFLFESMEGMTSLR